MITSKRIRDYVADAKSADKVRITRNGEIHYRVNGLWCFFGFTSDVADVLKQIDRDRDETTYYNTLYDRHR